LECRRVLFRSARAASGSSVAAGDVLFDEPDASIDGGGDDELPFVPMPVPVPVPGSVEDGAGGPSQPRAVETSEDRSGPAALAPAETGAASGAAAAIGAGAGAGTAACGCGCGCGCATAGIAPDLLLPRAARFLMSSSGLS